MLLIEAQLRGEQQKIGLYIAGPKETHAVYVTRNAVALIYFSDNPQQSGLLHTP